MNRRHFLAAPIAAAAATCAPLKAIAAIAPTPAIKVFRLNDYEWWAAATLAEAIADWKEWTGLTSEELDEPRELTAQELLSLKYVEVDDDMRESTFAEELGERVRIGMKFPQPFATTEY